MTITSILKLFLLLSVFLILPSPSSASVTANLVRTVDSSHYAFGSFTRSSCLTVNSGGDILIGDFYGYNIAVLSSNGTFKTSYPFGAYHLSTSNPNLRTSYNPSSIAIDPLTNNIFVLATIYVENPNVSGEGLGSIVLVLSASGVLLYNFTGGLASSAVGIAVTESGVYVSDTHNNRIAIFGQDGESIANLTATAPTSIAVDDSGLIYSLQHSGSVIVVQSSNGNVVTTYSVNVHVDVYGPGLFVDTSGIYYANVAQGTVQFLSTSSAPNAIYSLPGNSGPYSISTFSRSSAGNLYVMGNNGLVVFDSSGEVIEFIDGILYPSSISVDSAGTIFTVSGEYSPYSPIVAILRADGSSLFPGWGALKATAVAVSTSGAVYVTGAVYSQLSLISSNGSILANYNLPFEPDHPSIVIENDIIYISNRGYTNGKPGVIIVYANNGTIKGNWAISNSNPSGIAVRNGTVYLSDSLSGSILVYSMTGIRLSVYPVCSYPSTMTVDHFNTLYLACPGSDYNATVVLSSGGTLQGVIRTGFTPLALTVNSNNLLYIANQNAIQIFNVTSTGFISASSSSSSSSSTGSSSSTSSRSTSSPSPTSRASSSSSSTGSSASSFIQPFNYALVRVLDQSRYSFNGFYSLYSLAVDSMGMIYGANYYQSYISVLYPNGTQKTTYTPPSSCAPNALALDPNSNSQMLVVCTPLTGSNPTSTLFILDRSTGAQLQRLDYTSVFSLNIQGAAYDLFSNFYLTDITHNLILAFYNNGTLKGNYSSGVNRPSGITSDTEGRIYFTNVGTQSVFVLNNNLTLSANYSAGFHFQPYTGQGGGISVDNSGQISVLDSRSVTVLTSVGSLKSVYNLPGGNFSPNAIFQDQFGLIYIAGSSRLFVLNNDYSINRFIEGPISFTSISIEKQGTVYAAGYGFPLAVLSLNGSSQFPGYGGVSVDNVAVDPQGRILITGYGIGVSVLTLDGQLSVNYSLGTSDSYSIAVDSQYIYLVNVGYTAPPQLTLLYLNGTLKARYTPGFINPRSIAVDRSGFIYIGDAGAGRVIVMNNNGSIRSNYSVCSYISGFGVAVNSVGDIAVGCPSLQATVILYNNGTQRGLIRTLNTAPQGVAFDSADLLYISNYNPKNQTIQVFNVTLSTYPSSSTPPNSPTAPSFTLSSSSSSSTGGSPYVCFSIVRVIDGSLYTYGYFDSPASIVLDEFSGALLIADIFNYHVVSINIHNGTIRGDYTTPNAYSDQFFPSAVALSELGPTISNRAIYIAGDSVVGPAVYALAINGSLLWTYNSDLLFWPRDVAVDPTNGNIYMADFYESRILSFSPNGTVLSVYNYSTSGVHSPCGLFISGELLYVANAGCCVIIIDKNNGTLLRTLATSLSFNPSFTCGLRVSASGIVVSDPENNRVVVLSGNDFSVQSSFSASYPTSIAIDPVNQNIYTAELAASRVSVHNSDLSFQRYIPGNLRSNVITAGVDGMIYTALPLAAIPSNGNPYFIGSAILNAAFLAVDSFSQFYYTTGKLNNVNGENTRFVYVLFSNGSTKTNFSLPYPIVTSNCTGLTGIAVNASGFIFVADPCAASIAVLDNTGKLKIRYQNSVFSSIQHLTVDVSGRMYVATTSQLLVLSDEGSVKWTPMPVDFPSINGIAVTLQFDVIVSYLSHNRTSVSVLSPWNGGTLMTYVGPPGGSRGSGYYGLGQVAVDPSGLLYITDTSRGQQIIVLNISASATQSASLPPSYALSSSSSAPASQPLSLSSSSSLSPSPSHALSSSSSSTGVSSSVKGDPQFVGLLGQSYQIHGVSGEVYALITDQLVQINARFGFLAKGDLCLRDESGEALFPCWTHPGSYMTALSIRTHSNQVLLLEAGDARKGFASVAMLEGEYGEVVRLAVREKRFVGQMEVEYLDMRTVQVSHAGLYSLVVTNSDGFLNLQQLQVDDWNDLRTEVQSHGLIGQTWNKERSKGIEVRDVEGYVDDYVVVDGLTGCAFFYSKHQC